jgi:hypothetical protein
MSNQSSRATNSTSDAAACDEHVRAHSQSRWLFRVFALLDETVQLDWQSSWGNDANGGAFR